MPQIWLKDFKHSNHCGCGAKNDVDHTLNCKSGGYIIMRHNGIRDLEAELLRELGRDVKVRATATTYRYGDIRGINAAEKARLDVSAVGLCSPQERMCRRSSDASKFIIV